jgi:site-specific DNA-methyltransferase (adenine-specific)
MDKLILGDCLVEMANIADKSIDMILCDLPYGTTACKWDTIIPFEPLWSHYNRIIKENGAIVLTASQPFTSALVMSNPKMFRYCWVWNKNKAANFLFGNKMPMKTTEDVCVFYSKQPTYNPQKIDNPKGEEKRHNYKASLQKEETFKQHLPAGMDYTKNSPKYEANKLLPTVLLNFKKDAKPLHPTQKPVALFAYLIKTYTHEGEVVLDNCIGSGTTAVAAKMLGRHFIGIEREPEYLKIAKARIDAIQLPLVA